MRRHHPAIIASACILGLALVAAAAIQQAEPVFTRSTIDIGIVVSDVDASAKFYKEAIGFKELSGFDVSKEMAGDSGLTDYQPIHVRVLVLENESTATRVKIMSFPDAAVSKVDNTYISSSLGYSYLTLRVADTTAAVARVRRAGFEPVKEPYRINANTCLTLVKDPDGNIIEFVGPLR